MFVVPPYLLAHLASAEDPRFEAAATAARHALETDPGIRQGRLSQHPSAVAPELEHPTAATQSEPYRRIFDAKNSTELPGVLVRSDGGDTAPGDIAVTEAWDGLGATHTLLLSAVGWASVDGNNARLDATVHYGNRYDNAFWDGSRMVFGDGDGEVFGRFTASLSVIGHELAHGVIETTAGLAYQGQSGALAESIADAIGAMVEQHTLRHTADEASWIIGAELFTDLVQGEGLRNMLNPGTAYDDDVIGKDPQPAHMTDFVVTDADNGGVHLNSGIPNRAFALLSRDLGGFSWERAGVIWFDALTSGLPKTATFTRFATSTVTAAAARFGSGSREQVAVESAWQSVGVL
ncbi:M4 family peptidase [Salinibacterium hongtaonis]|uniref:Neutral metalloproteinase n=2 Tax=Homoserinimonas hongtaonis TaxID=2079791 RepID=A0A2U1SXN4_9MICO|nr:peptidase M4 family protein [Salinibacterium hongtaonis]PWB96395.1 M4 family peptidase [Salinibacterium hongtaonis]